jgi:hypothetical protein
MSTIFNETTTDNQSPIEPDPTQLQEMHRGANWFFWIAGLSLVNSAIFAFGGQISFIIGLAYTQIIDVFSDAIVEDGGPSFVRWLALAFNIGIFGFFALVGYYSNRAFKAAFLIGIAVYTIDALLWLLMGGYLEIAFHAYALIWIVKGFLASRNVSQYAAK